MQNDLNLTPLLRQKFESYPRTIGRYSSSELFYLINGKTTPYEWLNPPTKPLPLVLAMWNGALVHDHVQRLLPADYNEVKFEYEYTIPGTNDTIILVAKIDHLPNHVDEVWEFKTSKVEMPEAKAEHEFQSRLYCTITKRPIAKVFQPVQHSSGLYLKHLKTVTRDDVWFEEQMKKLAEFHYQVVALTKI